MKNFSILLLLALGLWSAKCSTHTADFPDSLYGQTWLYSYEEDSADVRTYRPNTYDFPPSRGRTGFMLQKGGAFVRYGIAPTDGLEEQPGKWEAMGKDRIRVVFDNPRQRPEELEVVAVTPEALKIKRKTSADQ